jgi:hypothetical protein
MAEFPPPWGQLTAPTIGKFLRLTSQATSAAVEVARDLAVSASLMMPFTPAIASGTPTADQPALSALGAAIVPGRAVWLAQLFAELDDKAIDANSQTVAVKTVVWANQVWQKGIPSLGLDFLPPGESLLDRQLKHDCQEAVAFAGGLLNGRLETHSADLIALARRVVGQLDSRKVEDIEEWAKRLVSDVGGAVD